MTFFWQKKKEMMHSEKSADPKNHPLQAMLDEIANAKNVSNPGWLGQRKTKRQSSTKK